MVNRIAGLFCIFLAVLCVRESSCSSPSSDVFLGDLGSASTAGDQESSTIVPEDLRFLSSTVEPEDLEAFSTMLRSLEDLASTVGPDDPKSTTSTVAPKSTASNTDLGTQSSTINNPSSTAVPIDPNLPFGPGHPVYDAQVEEAVKGFETSFKKVKKIMGQAIKMAMPYFMDSATSGELGLSPECQHSLFKWIADLRGLKPYALRSKNCLNIIEL